MEEAVVEVFVKFGVPEESRMLIAEILAGAAGSSGVNRRCSCSSNQAGM